MYITLKQIDDNECCYAIKFMKLLLQNSIIPLFVCYK